MKILTGGTSYDGWNILHHAQLLQKVNCFSRVQPQAVMQSLFTSTKHFINPFTISIKMKSWRIPNMLCCIWTFINISIHKGKLVKLVTQLAECRKYLAANMTPGNERSISLSNWSSRKATRLSSSLTSSPFVSKLLEEQPKRCIPSNCKMNIVYGMTST